MDADSTASAHGPRRTARRGPCRVPGELVFYGIDDPEWVALIIRRLAEGDVVTVDRWGDIIIMDGP